LVRRRDTCVNVELADPDTDRDREFQMVDDAIAAPVDRTVLFRRMENLLARRDQSRELTRQYERTEARFRALFQTIPDPAFAVDEEREITEANDAFCDLCEEDRPELVGCDPAALELFGACDDQRLQSALPGETSASAETGPQNEPLVVRDEGERRYLELRHQTRYVQDEPHTVVVMHDVTDLQETNEQLEDFASIVTHDLRNPMNVAMARIDIVRDRIDAHTEVDDDLDAVQDSLERMDDLIEGVRTLVRGTSVEEPEPLELETVARDAWDNVQTADGTLRCVDADVDVRAEERRLLQLFENLFRNSVEHGSTGSQTRSDDSVEHGSTSSRAEPDDAHDHGDDVVTVEVGRIDSEGFYVADDGPGIPAEHGEQVLEAGVTTSSGGSGLGLKIVSEIAAAHDWEVTVTDSEAGGARFEITEISSLPAS
jgi:PAS domain S-box-containing protein